MATIDYIDKIDNHAPPEGLVTAADMNEIKDVVNANQEPVILETLYLEDFGAVADGTLNDSVFLSPVYGGTDNLIAIQTAFTQARTEGKILTSRSSGYFRIKPTVANMLYIGSNMELFGFNLLIDNTGWTVADGKTTTIVPFYSSDSEILNTSIHDIKILTAANSTESIIAVTSADFNDLDATGYSQTYFFSKKEKIDVHIYNMEFQGIDRVVNLGSNSELNKYNIHDCKFNDCLMGGFFVNPNDSTFRNLSYTQERGRSQLWHGIYIGQDSFESSVNIIQNITGQDTCGKLLKLGGSASVSVDNIKITGALPFESDGTTLKSDWSLYGKNGNSIGTVYGFRGSYTINNVEILNRNEVGNIFYNVSGDSAKSMVVNNAIGGLIQIGMHSEIDVNYELNNCDFDEMLDMYSRTVVYTSQLILNVNNSIFGNSIDSTASYFASPYNQHLKVKFDECTFNFEVLTNSTNGWLFHDNTAATDDSSVILNNCNLNIEFDPNNYTGASNAKMIRSVESYFAMTDTKINVSYKATPTDPIHGGLVGFLTFIGGAFTNVQINEWILSKEYTTDPVFTSNKALYVEADINSQFLPSEFESILFKLGEYLYRIDGTAVIGTGKNFIPATWAAKVWNKGDVIENTSGEYYQCIEVGSISTIPEPTLENEFILNGWSWGKLDPTKIATGLTYTQL